MSQVHLNQCRECPYCRLDVPAWKLDQHITHHFRKKTKRKVERNQPDVIAIPDERPFPDYEQQTQAS